MTNEDERNLIQDSVVRFFWGAGVCTVSKETQEELITYVIAAQRAKNHPLIHRDGKVNDDFIWDQIPQFIDHLVKEAR
tara:strand:+ start:518 stop:751 length:234 start_codon:yes stop_codon:yes gene_type:complete